MARVHRLSTFSPIMCAPPRELDALASRVGWTSPCAEMTLPGPCFGGIRAAIFAQPGPGRRLAPRVPEARE
eukprot:6161301-Prymnesium_polylepis.1